METETVNVQETVTKVPRRIVPAREDREVVAKEKFSGFSIRLTTDPIGKKKFSNRLTIVVPDTRSESTIKMTLREASALKRFLIKNLPD
mgnify:CR=1 FL=1